MSYHNILSKNDRAFAAYLISKEVGTANDVFPAKRSQGKTLPCTICWSQKATETAAFSGEYSVELAIMIKTQGLDGGTVGESRLTADERVAATWDEIKRGLDNSGNKLADAVTAAARALAVSDPDNHADLAQYTCLNVFDAGPEAGFEEDSDVWVDTFNLRVVCAPADLSE